METVDHDQQRFHLSDVGPIEKLYLKDFWVFLFFYSCHVCFSFPRIYSGLYIYSNDLCGQIVGASKILNGSTLLPIYAFSCNLSELHSLIERLTVSSLFYHLSSFPRINSGLYIDSNGLCAKIIGSSKIPNGSPFLPIYAYSCILSELHSLIERLTVSYLFYHLLCYFFRVFFYVDL